jgi:hypothetical protein
MLDLEENYCFSEIAEETGYLMRFGADSIHSGPEVNLLRRIVFSENHARVRRQL